MRIVITLCLLAATAVLGATAPSRADLPGTRLPMELNDGDRVAFVGATFVERDAEHGYIETAMTTRWPNRLIRFRNFGWSGDNVFGEARARFGPPSEGFAHLRAQIETFAPTVVLVSYGANEADAGEAGLSRFRDGLGAMLDMLGNSQARLVLIAPLDQEALGPPLPDPTARNATLAAYRAAMLEIGEARQIPVIDLTGWQHARRGAPLTYNAIHLTPRGAWEVSRELVRRWLGDPPAWNVRIEANGPVTATGTNVSDLTTTPAGIRFRTRDERLPPAPPPSGDPLAPAVLSVSNLAPGRYTLSIDGTPLANASAEDWAKGQPLAAPAFTTQTEELRAAIAAKNQLVFHRWRPQNETYLYGFRKHEQGQNAREVPRFDELVIEQESHIESLKTPRLHTFELQREGAPTP